MKVFAVCSAFLFVLSEADFIAAQNDENKEVSTRIMGGHETAIEQYPFMVSTEYNWWWIYWSFYCGGALLSEKTVLSAASCYGSDKASWWRVRVGSTQKLSGGLLHYVDRIIIYPNYRSNDIGLLILRTPVQLTPRVQIARIPGKNFNLPNNAPLKALGWGRNAPSGNLATYLKQVEVTLVNHTLCTERYDYLSTQPGYQNLPKVGPYSLCAGDLINGGKDTCLYDEGGPLVYDKDIVVGVITFRYFRCGNAYYPGVYTRVSYFSDWIVQNGV